MGWANRKVLVTGADGFIGSHLVERLVELGADVRAFCFYNSNGSSGWLDCVPRDVRRQVEFTLGDVRDSAFVRDSCRGIDTVFHLAALVAIPYSYMAPESFVDTNIGGTLNVLKAVCEADCRRMIHTSTSEVYGTPVSLPIRESHPLQGQSPYSATKIAADKLCEAFFCSYGCPVVTLRPFNTYGPRQSMRAVLPTILAQLLEGDGPLRLGRLDTKRDLTFVADTVAGFICAAEVDSLEGEVLQLGAGDTVSIGELVEVASRLMGVSTEVVQEKERLRPNHSEVKVLLSDPTKARSILGWEATVPLEEGILRTARWLEHHSALDGAGKYYV